MNSGVTLLLSSIVALATIIGTGIAVMNFVSNRMDKRTSDIKDHVDTRINDLRGHVDKRFDDIKDLIKLTRSSRDSEQLQPDDGIRQRRG